MSGIPLEFSSFIGTSALFKIEVKNFQSQRFDRSRFETSYRVKRVCTEQLIIQQFQKLAQEHSVRVKLPYFCYAYLPFAQADLNVYGIKVGASSSRDLMTPQSNMKHVAVSKVGLTCISFFVYYKVVKYAKM